VSFITGTNLKVNKMEEIGCNECANAKVNCIGCIHNKNLGDFFKLKSNSLEKLFIGATVMLDTERQDVISYTVTEPILYINKPIGYAQAIRIPSEEEVIEHKLFNVWLVSGTDRPIFEGYEILIRDKAITKDKPQILHYIEEDDVRENDWNDAIAFMVLKDFEK